MVSFLVYIRWQKIIIKMQFSKTKHVYMNMPVIYIILYVCINFINITCNLGFNCLYMHVNVFLHFGFSSLTTVHCSIILIFNTFTRILFLKATILEHFYISSANMNVHVSVFVLLEIETIWPGNVLHSV